MKIVKNIGKIGDIKTTELIPLYDDKLMQSINYVSQSTLDKYGIDFDILENVNKENTIPMSGCALSAICENGDDILVSLRYMFGIRKQCYGGKVPQSNSNKRNYSSNRCMDNKIITYDCLNSKFLFGPSNRIVYKGDGRVIYDGKKALNESGKVSVDNQNYDVRALLYCLYHKCDYHKFNNKILCEDRHKFTIDDIKCTSRGGVEWKYLNTQPSLDLDEVETRTLEDLLSKAEPIVSEIKKEKMLENDKPLLSESYIQTRARQIMDELIRERLQKEINSLESLSC